MIAALYVERGGVYYGLPDVDPWDEARDARLYAGPWPVVAHPPCTAWSAWRAPTRQTTHGRPIGEDGGCFAAALEAVRTFGGVLEHPAHSIAWHRFRLPIPSRNGWVQSMLDDGWTMEVDQVDFGHQAEKRTWLYYVGPPPVFPLRSKGQVTRPVEQQGHRERSATPPAFRDALLGLARASIPSGCGAFPEPPR